MYEPAAYEAWYHTRRGSWIARREFGLMMALLSPTRSAALLDAGAGTGHFSRLFADSGLTVTALDPDPAMLQYARAQSAARDYVLGAVPQLPFADGAFDYAAAVTSLCFVPEPARALAELWRVSSRGLVLGLLNRQSLLHRHKADRDGYRGARWDTLTEVLRWARPLEGVRRFRWGSAIFFPRGGPLARTVEPVIPKYLPLGGFLAVVLSRY